MSLLQLLILKAIAFTIVALVAPPIKQQTPEQKWQALAQPLADHKPSMADRMETWFHKQAEAKRVAAWRKAQEQTP